MHPPPRPIGDGPRRGCAPTHNGFTLPETYGEDGGPMTTRRSIFVATLATLLLMGCGGGDELSIADYIDEVDAIFARGVERYEQIVATPEGQVLIVGQGEHLGFSAGDAQLTDFTPQDLAVALEQVAAIQDEALETAAAIDPPDQIADLHVLFFRELPIAELAARAATAADWYELSDSPEMAAYRTALARDNETCAEFQATLDAIAARGAFEGTPWIPGELTEIAEYALSCSSAPENPQDAYRPP